MQIIISGSLAYDRIMDFPERFSDHILPDKIHVLNVSFMVNGVREQFGGTAGNIAYSLALLGESPLILATAGKDFGDYDGWLRKHGLRTDTIRRISEEFTAGAYITTDVADNQITGFNPGAMKYPCLYDIGGTDPKDALAIVSPGNLEDMYGYPAQYKQRGIKYICDPGQQITALPKDRLREMIMGAEILISNDYELELIVRSTGVTQADILAETAVIITTLGEGGSVIRTPDGETHVPAVTAAGVVDPTGAGDAYRAGLIKGLATGADLLHAARMGAVCASFAVEKHGTQTHAFTSSEFDERFRRDFG